MAAKRILFVDDEDTIRTTLPVILERHGFEVTSAGTVSDALAQITSGQFDVLISDLNIGQPGDGLVVVSAMRRTQPECVTLILTGYPGFETALDAIRSQVDDYLIKPAPVPQLVALIEQKLKDRKRLPLRALKRMADILRENEFEIAQRTLHELKSHPGLAKLPLSDEERIAHIPALLRSLVQMLEAGPGSQNAAPGLPPAERQTRHSYQKGHTIPLEVAQGRMVQRAIYDVIRENLLSLNLSYLMLDLKRLNDSLGIELEHSLEAYLDAEQHSAPLPQKARRRERGEDA